MTIDSEIIKEKLQIAERAGKLAEQIDFYRKRITRLEWNKNQGQVARIKLFEDGTAVNISSKDTNRKCDTRLHEALIGYFVSVLEDLEKELDEIIKVLK